MSTVKELGRITAATFGFGGYDDAMIGLSISIGGKSWGSGDFKGEWAHKEVPQGAKWTAESRLTRLGEAVLYLRDLLVAAKVKDVAELVGVPIEATFDGTRLQSWRVLEEVL